MTVHMTAVWSLNCIHAKALEIYRICQDDPGQHSSIRVLMLLTENFKHFLLQQPILQIKSTLPKKPCINDFCYGCQWCISLFVHEWLGHAFPSTEHGRACSKSKKRRYIGPNLEQETQKCSSVLSSPYWTIDSTDFLIRSPRATDNAVRRFGPIMTSNQELLAEFNATRQRKLIVLVGISPRSMNAILFARPRPIRQRRLFSRFRIQDPILSIHLDIATR